MKKNILLLILVLVGCKNDLDKREAMNWWVENEAVATTILNLLIKSPIIERVEANTRKELIKNYKDFNESTWLTYRQLEKIIKNDNKLEVVTFYDLEDVIILSLIIDRYGLSIAGCSLSILYYSNDSLYEQNSKKHAIYSEKLKPNWYLEINGDKECIRHTK